MFRRIGSNIRMAIVITIVILAVLVVVYRPQDHTGGPMPGASSDIEVLQ